MFVVKGMGKATDYIRRSGNSDELVEKMLGHLDFRCHCQREEAPDPSRKLGEVVTLEAPRKVDDLLFFCQSSG